MSLQGCPIPFCRFLAVLLVTQVQGLWVKIRNGIGPKSALLKCISEFNDICPPRSISFYFSLKMYAVSFYWLHVVNTNEMSLNA